MSLLTRFWYRRIDRELDRKIRFPEIEGRGEWNKWVGLKGERLARKYIYREGGKVLYRNFRSPKGGEVDIVFRDEDTLVFGEVKTRTSEEFGAPADAVNIAKQKLIIRGANAWVRELNLPELSLRFDIFEVILRQGEIPVIRQREGAFQSPQNLF